MEDLDSTLANARKQAGKLADIKREMQAALILESAPSEEDRDDFDAYIVDWLTENRDKFAQAFDTLVSEHPGLPEEWKKDSPTVLKELKMLMK